MALRCEGMSEMSEEDTPKPKKQCFALHYRKTTSGVFVKYRGGQGLLTRVSPGLSPNQPLFSTSSVTRRLRGSVSNDVPAGNLLSKGLTSDTLPDHSAKDAHHSCAPLVDLQVKFVLQLVPL